MSLYRQLIGSLMLLGVATVAGAFAAYVVLRLRAQEKLSRREALQEWENEGGRIGNKDTSPDDHTTRKLHSLQSDRTSARISSLVN